MKKFRQLLLAAGLFALAGTASAAVIEGSIGFGGSYEIHDTTPTTTIVTDFLLGDTVHITSVLTQGTITGDFAAEGITAGDTASYSDFSYNPLGAVSALWSVGSFTFDLQSMSLSAPITSTFLALQGTGIITSTTAGLDQANGIWTFTANNAGANFTWSTSAAAVPEPSIALLLGVGLIGFGFARRARKTA